MEKKRSNLQIFLSYFYGNFIVLILGFIQTPLVTRIMSTDEYGRTGMFEAAVSCIYIFAVLGLDQSFIRYYYKRNISRKRLLLQCLIPPLVIVSVLTLVYINLSEPANMWLFGRHGVDITFLVAGYTIISVFERFLFLDVRMQQNGRLYSNVNIAQKVINIILIFVAFHFLENDFRVVLYAMTFSWGITTLFLLLRYIFLRKPDTFEDPGGEAVFKESEIIVYGLPFILILLMEWILSSCDRIALKQWADYAELGIYSAAMKIMVLLLTFKNTFLAYWSPVAMERFESGEEGSREFFRKAFDIVRYLCVMAAVGMILFRNLIVLLLGKEYRGADRIIPFLTLMPIFAIMFEITVQGIKFMKKNLYLNLAVFFTIIANIAGNFLLVPIFGGAGAALTTGASYVIYFVIGSAFSEKMYPVGYDYKRTAVDGVLLITYAALATFGNDPLFTYVVGAVLLAVITVIEKKSFGVLIDTVKKGLLRFGKGKAGEDNETE